MNCPICGNPIDDRSYMGGSTPTTCPKCGSPLNKEEAILEETVLKKEPHNGWVLFLAAIMLVGACFLPWNAWKAEWDVFKATHPAMTERIPSLASNEIVVDTDTMHDTFYKLFDYTDYTLLLGSKAETVDDAETCVENLSAMYRELDIKNYVGIYLLETEDSEKKEAFDKAFDEYMEAFKTLRESPSDKALISQCREKNAAAAELIGISFKNL